MADKMDPLSFSAIALPVFGSLVNLGSTIFGGSAQAANVKAQIKAQALAQQAQAKAAQYGLYAQSQQESYDAAAASARNKTLVLWGVGAAAFIVAGYFVYKATKKS